MIIRGRLPNFVIAGAPKCGTTALFEYLQTHPQIFLSDPKEPHYHAEDLGSHRSVFTWQEYLQLFENAGETHRAVGEASVWSLHSEMALERMGRDLPEARWIFMLRNPLDLLRSLHADLVWVCFEDEPDFERAWSLQDERRKGRCIPRLCQVPWFLDYRRVGLLGQHVGRMLDILPAERVKIFLFDDFKQSPRRVYEETLAFLGLPLAVREEFPQVNASKRNRLAWLARCQAAVVQATPGPIKNLGRRVGLNVLNRWLARLNSRPHKAPPLRDSFRAELIDAFRDDIQLLAELLRRDLSAWTDVPESKS